MFYLLSQIHALARQVRQMSRFIQWRSCVKEGVRIGALRAPHGWKFMQSVAGQNHVGGKV